VTQATSTSLEKVAITGQGADDSGQQYLKLAVAGSPIDLPPYSTADLLEPKKRLFPELGDAGCRLLSRSSQNALISLIEAYDHKTSPDFLVVPRLGSFGNYYVRPRSIVGRPPQPIQRALGSLDASMLQKYRWRGSLRRWQKQIGLLCEGNSRLMFAASLACTGPILPLVAGPRTGGFQITGPAETGKTTAAMVAGSIWGCHRDASRAEKGFAESWNTTLNKLDETAQAHCDALLILDETNLAGTTEKDRAAAVLSGAFRLAEGGKKQRFNQAEGPGWRFYFLSTSNLTLEELAVAGRVPVDDQHRGRLTDVLLPRASRAFGIYEDLHGFEDGAAMTDALKARCRRTFGKPGYEFVRRLYRNKKSVATARTFIAARRAAYLKCARRRAAATGVKPLERATARFATVYAAGSLAIRYGIFTWKRSDLLRAILACQFDSLVSAGVTSPADALARRLAEYFKRNQSGFLNLDQTKIEPGQHRLGSAPGYTHTWKGTSWVYLTSDQLAAVIGNDQQTRRLKGQLVKAGIMAATGHRQLVQRPIFHARGNKGYRWVHAFRADALRNWIDAP
jgi:hypothetical protein